MNNRFLAFVWWQLLPLWLLLVAVVLVTRPLTPIDETRYAAVAWEMWLRGDFLVPHLNGETYAHKPPLLFWLYQLGWWLFGVNDWWPRLVAPLFGLVSIALTLLLGRKLWPDRPQIAGLSVWLLFGSLYWMGYGTAAMFDMLVVFFTLLGVTGAWLAGTGRRIGWLWLGLAIGLGILSKGPVILLHTLPVALLAPWWSEEARSARLRWYLGLLGALFLGVAIALAWAVPAALRGGEEYANAIFWGQTAERMVDSFAHRHPAWWYLPLLPVLLFPWFWWPPIWQGLRRLLRGRGSRIRFCLAWMLPSFVMLSLISGKQAHYLLPLFPAAALLMARGLDGVSRPQLSLRLPALVLLVVTLLLAALPWWQELPEWSADMQLFWLLGPLAVSLLLWRRRPETVPDALRWLTLASLVVVVSLHLVMRVPLARAYDLGNFAAEIARLQKKGVPLVHEGKYAGEFHFTGRLRKPLAVARGRKLDEWAREHPHGYIIAKLDEWERNLLPAECPVQQPYRGDRLALIPARTWQRQFARHPDT